MLVSALITILAAQDRFSDPNASGGKAIAFERYQRPFVGGQLEMVLGIRKHEKEYLGLFSDRMGPRASGKDIPVNSSGPINWIEQRVGYMNWFVGEYPLDSVPSTMLSSEAMYRQEMVLTKRIKLDLTNRETRTYWVDANGKILKEEGTIQLAKGTYSMSATFKPDDSYDLELDNPDSTTKSNVHPGCTMADFNAAFTPMLYGAKVLKEYKTFYIVDTLTGAPVQVRAHVFGHFTQKWPDGTMSTGHTVDFDFNGIKQRAYVGDGGHLLRVDCPYGLYLNVDSKPGGLKKLGG